MLFQNGCHFIDQNVGNRTKINETEQVLKGSLIVLDVENKALYKGLWWRSHEIANYFIRDHSYPFDFLVSTEAIIKRFLFIRNTFGML